MRVNEPSLHIRENNTLLSFHQHARDKRKNNNKKVYKNNRKPYK